jgi:nucleotide-binding universal stress UspA family protein
MKIVAAIDASPAARGILEKAIAYSRLVDGELHVAHVFQPPSSVYSMEGIYVIEDERFEEAERKMVWSDADEILDGSGLDWVRADLRGYPPTAIVEYANEIEADLIVLGTRGRGGFSSLVLGSTSHAVIHDAECDVLIVRTQGRD